MTRIEEIEEQLTLHGDRWAVQKMKEGCIVRRAPGSSIYSSQLFKIRHGAVYDSYDGHTWTVWIDNVDNWVYEDTAWSDKQIEQIYETVDDKNI